MQTSTVETQIILLRAIPTETFGVCSRRCGRLLARCALSWYNLPCCDMICSVMLCHVMRCYVMLCYVEMCCVMLYYDMMYDGMTGCGMTFYAWSGMS